MFKLRKNNDNKIKRFEERYSYLSSIKTQIFNISSNNNTFFYWEIFSDDLNYSNIQKKYIILSILHKLISEKRIDINVNILVKKYTTETESESEIKTPTISISIDETEANVLIIYSYFNDNDNITEEEIKNLFLTSYEKVKILYDHLNEEVTI